MLGCVGRVCRDKTGPQVTPFHPLVDQGACAGPPSPSLLRVPETTPGLALLDTPPLDASHSMSLAH